jgi:hypothetical protein
MMMRCGIAVLALAAIVSGAHGQYVGVPSFLFKGDAANDAFGIAVANAGDVNGDGFDDVIVGAYQDDNNGTDSGSIRVYSGASGALLYAFNGAAAGDRFGLAVAGAGDVNADGRADFIVGADGTDTNGQNSGSARVFSGANGATLYTFLGDSALDWLGFAVSGAGDVNGDGRADLIVGAMGDDNNGIGSGSARVFSGATGAILYTFNGDAAGDELGRSVNSAGDVNGDGRADLIVGAALDDNTFSGAGSARVYSGLSGAILYTFNGSSPGEQFGWEVAGVGDVNGDGRPDVAVGSLSGDFNENDNVGAARIYSGANGAILYTFFGDTPGGRFGSAISRAGDVNGDGRADIIVGDSSTDNNGQNSGSARVFSGADGAVLATFNGNSAFDGFGNAVSAGDINDDGLSDLIVAAADDDPNGTDSGSVRVYLSVNLSPCPGDADGSRTVNFLDITTVLANFGTACP